MDLELKSLFARLTLFAGLFFASAIPGVGDAGGGAGGDEGGGGEGGDDGGSGEDGGSGVGGDEEGVEGEESEGDDGEGDEGDGAGDDDADGEEGERGEDEGRLKKKLDVQKALDKLKKSDRMLADVLRKEHFSNVDYRTAFATPTEAQAAADLLNLVGGEEGITATQAKADEFAKELTMVSEGDPQILDDIVRDTPEGFKKLMGAGLEKLRLLDQAAYEKFTARPLINALREKGVINTLEMIKQMAVAGKGQECFDLTTKLLSWAAGVEDFANRVQQEQPAAHDKTANEKLDRATQIERRAYQREVGKASNDATSGEIKRHLDPLIRDALKKGVRLSLEQKQDVTSGIYTEIANALKINTGYQRQMEAYYAKNADADDIANYVRQKVASLAQNAAKKVWARKGWANARGKVRTAAAGGNNGTGSGSSIFISKPPDPENIDWSKDPQRSRFMGDGKRGEATLRSGKVVRFRWDT